MTGRTATASEDRPSLTRRVWREAAPLAAAAAWILALFLGGLSHAAADARVVVRWDPSLAGDERTRLEQRFSLVDAESKPANTWNYHLRDRSAVNVQALLTHSAVIGTTHIDRSRLLVELDEPAWPRWMVRLAERGDIDATALVAL